MRLAPALATLLVATAALAQTAPAPEVQRPRYAVALSAGEMRTSADPTAPIVASFAAGAVFDYWGEVKDAFGHPWAIVGDPEAFTRRESWAALAATPEEISSLMGGADLLTAIPSPRLATATQLVGSRTPEQVLADARAPIRVPAEWWRSVRRERFQLAEGAEILGVPSWAVPPAIVDEALELLGGRDALGPWPRDPAFGRLHIAPLVPVYWRYDGQSWQLAQGGRSQLPMLGLLGNPRLLPEPLAPQEATGSTLSCWSLVGGLAPSGLPAGKVASPAVAPLRVAPGARQAELSYLGLTDLGARAWPPATERLVAPRRVIPEAPVPGALLQDLSSRQAVYLEQLLPASLVHQLRGRTLRLFVVARANPLVENINTVTVSIELLAGELREMASAAVGVLPTPLGLEALIPGDAEEIRVRLIPNDRSIAVQEIGEAVFEMVALMPVEWPARLEPSPLQLRRVRLTTYDTTRRYVRVPVAVSERQPEELTAVWQAIAQAEWTEQQRRDVLAGEPRPGMPAEQVILAWGEPEARTAIGTGERWDWPGQSAAFDADGRLVAWSREDDPALRPPPRCLLADPPL